MPHSDGTPEPEPTDNRVRLCSMSRACPTTLFGDCKVPPPAPLRAAIWLSQADQLRSCTRLYTSRRLRQPRALVLRSIYACKTQGLGVTKSRHRQNIIQQALPLVFRLVPETVPSVGSAQIRVSQAGYKPSKPAEITQQRSKSLPLPGPQPGQSGSHPSQLDAPLTQQRAHEAEAARRR